MRIQVTLVAGCAFLLSAGCGDDVSPRPPGYLSVLVTDNIAGPVADQSIRVTPAGATGATSAAGLALFVLAPGDYFVDAGVCCAGPGMINYHVPVTVFSGDTARVTLNACLTCD